MSTSIEVRPSTDVMPLVEQIRARTEQLFSEFLLGHGIASHIEVVAHNWTTGRSSFGDSRASVAGWYEPQYELLAQWQARWERHRVSEPDVKVYCGEEPDYPPEMLGKYYPIDWEDCGVDVPQIERDRCEAQKHYWQDERSFGSGTIVSTGYGFVMAAIAEATQGRIMS